MERFRIFAVARFEFLAVVRRWSFWLVTLAMPLLFATLLLGIGYLQGAALDRRAKAPRVYGLVDQAGIVLGATEGHEGLNQAGIVLGAMEGLEGLNQSTRVIRFVAMRSQTLAEEARLGRRIAGYFVVPHDFVEKGKVARVASPQDPLDDLSNKVAQEELTRILRAALLRGRVDEAIAKRVSEPIEVERLAAGGQGALASEVAESLMPLIPPILQCILLMMALLGTSSYLLQGLGLEKENKIIEVLLSAVRTEELFLGKLLGLGAAGLVQFTIWGLCLTGGLLVLALGLGFQELVVPWRALLAGMGFVGLGYFFVGSLMLATGAMGQNSRESQQYALIWTSPIPLPVALIGVVLSDPHGALATFFSWFPPTAPVGMVLRLSIAPGEVPFWQVAGSAALLLSATWAAVVIGSRWFRLGLVSGSSRVSFRALLGAIFGRS